MPLISHVVAIVFPFLPVLSHDNFITKFVNGVHISFGQKHNSGEDPAWCEHFYFSCITAWNNSNGPFFYEIHIVKLPRLLTQVWSVAGWNFLHFGMYKHTESLDQTVSSIRARYLVHTSRLLFIFFRFFHRKKENCVYLHLNSASAYDVK